MDGARAALFLAVVLVISWNCIAGVISLEKGGLSVDLDDSTGALVEIRYGQRVLAKGGTQVYPITFATGPADKPIWIDSTGAARRLLRQERPSPDVLELTISAGDYELVERYRLHEQTPRLDRSVRLTYRGQEQVKLRDIYFRTPGLIAPREGFVRFPGAWPAVSHPFATMKPGAWRGATGSIAPMGVELGKDLSVLFASYTQDSPGAALIEGKDTVEIRQSVGAQGIVKPGVGQEIGFVSMQVVPAGYWAALPKLWDWMDSVGLKVPEDRPDWIRGAVLYGFHPGGTIGSAWRDLGGFEAATERLLPDLPKLGVTGVWVLPIESESPYWPKDYYRLMEGIGTLEQYKAMVKRAHGLKLHVLQDMVPHGGSPKSVHNIQHPEFMLRKEDGTTFDYWLNDFGNQQWQAYIAGVARHYVKECDVDGYRIDACYGSKDSNWNPEIPYARASFAGMQGGLGMDAGIRAAVRELKPRDGATLAEVESARHAAVLDVQYDFAMCYTVLPSWGKMPAEEFAARLQDYLEERKYAYPRGTLLLRHVESHDSLRAQMWYGIGGMHALYALTAWIDGVPLLYQNMEIGHSDAIARINATRHEHPEIARGEASYRAVQCDRPGVFTCLRSLNGKQSVIAINLGRERVETHLSWASGQADVALRSLEYRVVGAEPAMVSTGDAAPPTTQQAVLTELPDVYALEGANEWFIDTLEGRLQDRFGLARTSGQTAEHDGIYWRSQIPSLLWRGDMLPLDPRQPRLGYRTADGSWRVLDLQPGDCSSLKLVERHDGKQGLVLLGGKGLSARVTTGKQLPEARDAAWPARVGPAVVRCVGNDIIVSNNHYTLALRRQGGVVRQISTAKMLAPVAHDLYGDQAAFATGTSTTINASFDAEGSTRIWSQGDELRLRFEGQLRGMDRFALKSPPVQYYNEYIVTSAAGVQHHWGFKSDAGIGEKQAFLTFLLPSPGGDGFRFSRDGAVVGQGRYKAEPGRQTQMRGTTLPDRIDFMQGEKPVWSLTHLKTPAEASTKLFVDGSNLFLTLIDGQPAAMEKGRWYDFSCTWEP